MSFVWKMKKFPKNEIIDDMVRLLKQSEREYVTLEWKLNDDKRKTIKHYIVCLADVWAETNVTINKIPEWWLSEKEDENGLNNDIEEERKRIVLKENIVLNPFKTFYKQRICFLGNYYINIAVFEIEVE